MTDVKEEFQVLDTTTVQVRSLLNYMYAMGYTLDFENTKGRFVTQIEQFQGNRWIGFDTAKKMHNSVDSDWEMHEDGSVSPTFAKFASPFSIIGYRLAQASKLVDRVKLRMSKQGQVVVQSQMVVPLNAVVASLLNV